jgi:putative sterol carrier protein
MNQDLLAKVTTGLADAIGSDCGLGARVRLDFGADGSVLIDARGVPNRITNEPGDADCTLQIAIADFVDMAQGRLNGTAAFMTGRLTIRGDMALAVRFGGVLRRKEG